MRILLAGATGAIGRPLVRRLVEAGHEVVGLTAGRNLGLWTRWTGIDPELFQTAQQFDRTEQAQVPVLQQAVVSLNLTF